jgi:hypothetical protein
MWKKYYKKMSTKTQTTTTSLSHCARTGTMEYPALGWYVLQYETGNLHLPAQYATHIDAAVLTALGVDCTYETTIVGQEEDGTTSLAEFFNTHKPLKFDPTYRLYLITGVEGRYPSVANLAIRGAFHESNEVEDNAEPVLRTGLSFAKQMHSDAYEFLRFARTPKSLPGKNAPTTSGLLQKIRDFKKNTKRRYTIIDNHLAYRAGSRHHKNVVRNIRIRTMDPHRIVPFEDEIDKVRKKFTS